VVVSLFPDLPATFGYLPSSTTAWVGLRFLLFVEGDEEIMLSTKYPIILKYNYLILKI
jgi:hypothetical protein